MKVCVISNLFPPYHRGGAERVVASTIAGLKARGFDVMVITAAPRRSGYRASKLVEEDGVRVYRFFPYNLFFYGDDFLHSTPVRFVWHIFDVFNIFSYFTIKRILQRERPDVVHTHNLKGIGYLIPLLVRRLGIHYVHTLHDVQLVTPSGIIMKYHERDFPNNFFLTRLYERVNKWLFESPSVLISPSKFLMNFYEARGFFKSSKKIILPNPVDRVGGEAHRFSQDPAVCRFVYLGQIEEHKGVLLLIKTFRAFVEGNARVRDDTGRIQKINDAPSNSQNILPTSKWHLTVVGSGSKFTQACALADGCPQISLRGRVGREELQSILRDADVTVVPSLCYENSPTVIFESFAFGVPVLASAIEGVSELIQDGKNGLTFTAGNAEELARGLKWFVDNRGQWPEMSMSAQQSLKGLDLASYLDKLVNLCYSKMLLI